MYRFDVNCIKPKSVKLGECNSLGEAKDRVFKHYEESTGEILSGVDRIVYTTSLMALHSADIGKYRYILENK